MESKDFVAIVEVTDENLIKKLDELEEGKTNIDEEIGYFDTLNKKLHLSAFKDVFKLKLQKERLSKQNFILQIDNSEYIDYDNYRDYLAEYRRNNNGRKPDKFHLKSIIQKQKEENQRRIRQSKEANLNKRLILGTIRARAGQ